MDSEPVEEYVEDDLPGNKAWARRMTVALDEQIGMLTAHRFAPKATPDVDSLVIDLRSARAEWAKAAAAADVDTFYDHYDAGYALLDVERAALVRQALGLATTPPGYDPEGGSGDGGDGSGDTGIQV